MNTDYLVLIIRDIDLDSDGAVRTYEARIYADAWIEGLVDGQLVVNYQSGTSETTPCQS